MTVIKFPEREPGDDYEPDDNELQSEHEPADSPGTVFLEGDPRDILPSWAKDRDEFMARLHFHRRRYAHKAAYHTVRSPKHLVSTLWYAGRGVLRIAGKLLTWQQWKNGWILESQAVAKGPAGHGEAMGAHQQGRKTRGSRGKIIGISAVIALALILATIKFVPLWALILIAVFAIWVLANIGTPAGKPLIEPAHTSSQFEKITLEILTRGLLACDIKGINQLLNGGGRIDFLSDPYQVGEGWGCRANLPYGVTAGMVIARRDRLASGVRRPLSAVWPEPVPDEHEGALDIWIGFTDMARQKQKPWPLLKAGHVDIFQPVPFATSPRGKTITEALFQGNYLIGSAPGNGKTNAVRVLGCAAALDPVCDLWVHELAGKSDLSMFSHVAHRYVSGLDDAACWYTYESLLALEKDLKQRSELFAKIPIEARPDGALTRALAKADKRLRPKVVIIDECQNLFMHPQFGEEAARLAAYIIRVGRAYGIIVILATQRPGEKELPTAIRSLVTIRFCMKVADWQANDMILGTGAYNAGFNAVAFRHETDAGLGWLKGTADPAPVKTFKLDLGDAKQVIDRARATRIAAGVLGGYAAGETDDTDARSFLADVLTIFHGDDKLWSESIAFRLSAEMADVYADITPAAVGDQLRALGVEVKQVRETGAGVKSGCWREAVEAANGGRNLGQVAGE